jgi:ATP phosphoribosyltransferase
MLRIVLPKGSLERQTFELFADADLTLRRASEVDYRATIDDRRVAEVRILRPQEIPVYVADGLFDLGITGRDWIEETSAEVTSLGQLRYNKATGDPIRVVLAVDGASAITRVEDLPAGARVATEYPRLTERYLLAHGVKADIRLSYGATEAKVPEIADAVVEITETGRALRAAGLRVIAVVLESYPELIANPLSAADSEKAHAMDQLLTLLHGALRARSHVLVKLNVAEADLEQMIGLLPSMKAPTVSKLFGEGGYAIETVVPKAAINVLIPELKDRGASDVLELPLSKIVP